MNKKVLITGITGQDGSYLADILLEKGYEVHGLIRYSSVGNTQRIDNIKDKIILHQGDMLDLISLDTIIRDILPDEIYHEADLDHIDWSHSSPQQSYNLTAAATGGLLEIIKNINTNIKVFIPLSVTMFGDQPLPHTEETGFNPQSPYACGKVMAYYLAKYYREVHGVKVSTGTLYSHDSPRRGENYLLHKICRQALEGTIEISSPEMLVGIGHARDFMEAAVAILQQDKPDDFLIGTGQKDSIKSYIDCISDVLNIPLEIVPNDKFNRPGKQVEFWGDTSKVNKFWQPKISKRELIKSILDKYFEI